MWFDIGEPTEVSVRRLSRFTAGGTEEAPLVQILNPQKSGFHLKQDILQVWFWEWLDLKGLAELPWA